MKACATSVVYTAYEFQPPAILPEEAKIGRKNAVIKWRKDLYDSWMHKYQFIYGSYQTVSIIITGH